MTTHRSSTSSSPAAPVPGSGVPAHTGSGVTRVLGGLSLIGLGLLLALALLISPADQTMGDVVRIMYVHVPSAITAYLAFGITALGLHDGARFRERYPHIRYVRGDACALPFEDGAFDVVHSNAVIEHVGGRERQEAFVREALRVGRRVFVTTPNRWFPVEVHTKLPLVHWLPPSLAGRAYDLARMPWARANCLLGPADLRRLFPGPVRIDNLWLTLVAST